MTSVNQFPQSLREVVEIALRKHGVESGRQLSERSRSLGYPITYTVLNQLLAGEYRRRMSPETRERLSKLSGVRRSVVDKLAGAPLTAPFVLPADQAASLTGDQREAILAVLRSFAAANERADEVVARAAYNPDHPMRGEVDDETDR